MALLILYATQHLNANTTIDLMYKTFVVKPREKTTVHLCGVYFFYMNVCCTVSENNFPNVITFTYQI